MDYTHPDDVEAYLKSELASARKFPDEWFNFIEANSATVLQSFFGSPSAIIPSSKTIQCMILPRSDGNGFALWVRVKSSDPDLDARDGYPDHIVDLCEYLAKRVTENGYKVANATNKTWLAAMARTIEQAKELRSDENESNTIVAVKNLITWATNDSFWRQNIRSAPKFEHQYNRLRLAALDDHRTNSRDSSKFDWDSFSDNPYGDAD